MTTPAASIERSAPVRRADRGRGLRLSREQMWAAFARRDARYDGCFVTAVHTTGIFCRPSCTCRKPRPERVAFFPSPEAAARAGFRPCKRCRPELAGGAAEAERRMAARALALMRAHGEERLTLSAIARSLVTSPSNFARRFRSVTGASPMRALADLRAQRAEELLARRDRSVLDIALAAGFGSAAGFVRAFRRRTGLTPSAWRAQRRRNGGSP